MLLLLLFLCCLLHRLIAGANSNRLLLLLGDMVIVIIIAMHAIAVDFFVHSEEFDIRELFLHEMSEGGVPHDLNVRLEVFAVLSVRIVNLFARNFDRKVDRWCFARLVCFLRVGTVRRVSRNVGLEESSGVLVSVERKSIRRFFAVVAVYSRGHPIHHHVFPDGFQLIMGAILKVQEGIEANFLSLEDVGCPESFPFLVPRSLLRVGQAGHGHPHEVHVVLVFGQLCDVEAMSENELRVHVFKAIIAIALAAFAKALPHLIAVLFEFCRVNAFG